MAGLRPLLWLVGFVWVGLWRLFWGLVGRYPSEALVVVLTLFMAWQMGVI